MPYISVTYTDFDNVTRYSGRTIVPTADRLMSHMNFKFVVHILYNKNICCLLMKAWCDFRYEMLHPVDKRYSILMNGSSWTGLVGRVHRNVPYFEHANLKTIFFLWYSLRKWI